MQLPAATPTLRSVWISLAPCLKFVVQLCHRPLLALANQTFNLLYNQLYNQTFSPLYNLSYNQTFSHLHNQTFSPLYNHLHNHTLYLSQCLILNQCLSQCLILNQDHNLNLCLSQDHNQEEKERAAVAKEEVQATVVHAQHHLVVAVVTVEDPRLQFQCPVQCLRDRLGHSDHPRARERAEEEARVKAEEAREREARAASREAMHTTLQKRTSQEVIPEPRVPITLTSNS
mmetsp:Transcript_6216/g.9455  ORF Transcript_6216/g.9455 Transcript_6216/m.9455 type:complete len:230 (+) Transcript_6216:442-1131(+)